MTTDTPVLTGNLVATHSEHAAHLLQHPPAACTPLDSGLRIPTNLLAPNPLNPRKRWDPERIAKMADSLRANGQVQPIRVRPNPAYTPANGRAPYEIVVGETRWRAAPGAGLASLEAMVGDYTDQQVIELGLVENRDRNELHPLEEADAYDSLLRKPDGLQGYASVQAMADALGVSASYVYQRLKLRALCPAGREAFIAGEIDASVALLIARMPDIREQTAAARRIVQGFGGEPFSYRAAAEWLKREYMLSLDRAKFDIQAAYTVAGPCADCHNRSGAAPDLFADVAGAGDMCQDSACFAAKTNEAHEQLLQTARDEGHTVLRAHDARKLMATPTATPTGHWRLADACPTLTDSRKPLAELLPAGAARVLVEHPDSPGSVIQLATDAVVRATLKRKGLLRPPPPAPAPAPVAPRAPVVSPQPKAAAPVAPARAGVAPPHGGGGSAAGAEFSGQAAERAALDAKYGTDWMSTAPAGKPHPRAGEFFGHLLINALHTHVTEADEPPVLALRLAVVRLFDDITVEATKALYGVMGWSMPATDRMVYRRLSDDFEHRVETATPRRLADLLALLLVVERLTDGDVTPTTVEPDSAWQQLAALYRIDMQTTWQQADAAAQCGADIDAAYGGWLATQPPAPAAAPQDATEAFLAAHATATTSSTTEPGDGQSEQFDEGDTDD